MKITDELLEAIALLREGLKGLEAQGWDIKSINIPEIYGNSEHTILVSLHKSLEEKSGRKKRR